MAPQPSDDDGSGIIGRSPAIQRLRWLIGRAAPTEATVLILGARGTGKELVARAIQRQSRRRGQPFIIVNCAAVPSELLASELFGHERGAFTGAAQRALGLVRAADRGTLFLDEVGDLSAPAQAMLLRVLQQGEVRPVGSTTTVAVDVRIIAATNKDLQRAVARGRFRADLLDRLREFVIEVPSLAQRREDVALLANHFLVQQSRRHGREARGLSAASLRALRAHAWPGNVRELEHAMSRAVILADRGQVTAADLGLPTANARRGDTSRTGRGGFGIGDGRADGPRRQDADLDTPAGPSTLTARQRGVLRLTRTLGVVRRADLMTHFGVSSETARKDLGVLVDTGLLRRRGAGRGTAYRPS